MCIEPLSQCCCSLLGPSCWSGEREVVVGECAGFKGVWLPDTQPGCLEQPQCQGPDQAELCLLAG